ncbi:hypothetical protein [Niallia sp. FSL M8-0099]
MSTNNRLAMINSLKTNVVSYLRDHAFKGAFHHLEDERKIILI